MTHSLDGRVVVVTGASRGLGRAFAENVAARGASVGLLARDGETLAEVAESIPTAAIAAECDVADSDQVTAAFRKIAERFGRIDGVVANAGGQLAANRAAQLPVEKWRATIDLNITGAYLTARAGYEYLGHSHAGRMIPMSSGAAKAPLARMCAYAAAKSGIEGLVRSLCVECARDGICVNAAAPRLIDNRASRDVPKTIPIAFVRR